MMMYRHPIVSRPSFSTYARWRRASVAEWGNSNLTVDFLQVGDVCLIVVVTMRGGKWDADLVEWLHYLIYQSSGIFPERVFSSDEIAVQNYIVWALRCQKSFHSFEALSILFRTPVIPRIFTEVQIRENHQLERSIGVEREAAFARVRIENSGFISRSDSESTPVSPIAKVKSRLLCRQGRRGCADQSQRRQKTGE